MIGSAAKRVDQLNEQLSAVPVNQECERRSSSTLTLAGCVTA
jgi:hypothetical protein